MGNPFKYVCGSVTAPQGYVASGVYCDIKRLGTGKGSRKGRKPDLALIVSEVPAAVAGMFTTNQICAAPVKVCLPVVRQGTAQAIVVNSGNANACTGAQGLRDARQMAALAGHELGLSDQHVLVASTGRIGLPLPMKNVQRGINLASWSLGSTVDCADSAVQAIMTSDTRDKQIAVEIRLGGKTVRIGGIAKGAGMIQPGMSATGKRPAAMAQSVLHATMLAFVTTDAALEHKTLQRCLQEAVAHSFNRVTIDGDMSTNDTVLVMANGLAGNPVLKTSASGRKSTAKGRTSTRDLAAFQSALNHVCLALAKMLVKDGEGVSRFVTVKLEGARTLADADAAVRAVANSALVKTSWCGGDPNWGRIIDALGYSSARVVEELVDIAYRKTGSRQLVYSLKKGQPTRISFETLCKMVADPEFELHINLNLGKGEAIMYASDLTEAYVDFNKGDISDPASLGG